LPRAMGEKQTFSRSQKHRKRTIQQERKGLACSLGMVALALNSKGRKSKRPKAGFSWGGEEDAAGEFVSRQRKNEKILGDLE